MYSVILSASEESCIACAAGEILQSLELLQNDRDYGAWCQVFMINIFYA